MAGTERVAEIATDYRLLDREIGLMVNSVALEMLPLYGCILHLIHRATLDLMKKTKLFL